MITRGKFIEVTNEDTDSFVLIPLDSIKRVSCIGDGKCVLVFIDDNYMDIKEDYKLVRSWLLA